MPIVRIHFLFLHLIKEILINNLSSALQVNFRWELLFNYKTSYISVAVTNTKIINFKRRKEVRSLCSLTIPFQATLAVT